jgi:hypothetical protein
MNVRDPLWSKATATKQQMKSEWAAWLYDLLQPQVQEVLVCNPRRNALLKEGSKSDKVDARKLADLLRSGMLRPVYHGENGLRTLREFGRSYQTIGKDLTRVMNRLKAVYRGWGIPCAGTRVYAACTPAESGAASGAGTVARSHRIVERADLRIQPTDREDRQGKLSASSAAGTGEVSGNADRVDLHTDAGRCATLGE